MRDSWLGLVTVTHTSVMALPSRNCEASVHSARTKLANSKFFPIVMFSLHGLLLLTYIAVLVWAFPNDDAAFENGVFQFGFGCLYLGLLLASALGNTWVVAKIEVAFGVAALIFSVWGTLRDWHTRRLAFVYIWNTIWSIGIFAAFIATIIHYIALNNYRRILKMTYGSANAEAIVFGEVVADQSAATRQNNESFSQLLADDDALGDDYGYIGASADKGVFSVVATGQRQRKTSLYP